MRKIFILLLITFLTKMTAQEMYKIDYSYTDIKGAKLESSLFTNNKEATYKIYDSRKRGMVDLPNGEISFIENDELSKFYYANDTIAYARFSNYDEEIVYSDLYKNKMNWKINVENKKKIGRYNCTEAKIRLNQRSFTVWFTLDVPIKFGPFKLHDLPGMIVEATEDTGFFKISLTGISKTKDIKEFNSYKKYFFEKKKIMNYKQYEKKVIDDEVAAQIRVYNFVKEENLRTGRNSTVISNFSMAKDEYLEYPSNLVSELEKVPK